MLVEECRRQTVKLGIFANRGKVIYVYLKEGGGGAGLSLVALLTRNLVSLMCSPLQGLVEFSHVKR